MNKVSVIMPCFNAEKYISESIESVLNQTYENFEIILVDDSSTDNTPNIIKKYVQKHGDKLKYISQPNQGPSAARNNGVRNSTGDLIAFLDSDDIYVKDSLEKKIMKLKSDKELTLVYSDAFIIYESELTNYHYKKIVEKFYEGYVFPQLMVNNFICTSTVMLKKEVFNSIGYFNEKIKGVEDYEFWLKISKKDFKIGLVDEPLTYYRIRKGSLTDNNLKNVEDLISVFNKFLNTNDDTNNRDKQLIKNNLKRYHSEFFILKAKSYLASKNYSMARKYYNKICKYNRTNIKYYFIIVILMIFPQSLRYLLKNKKNHRGFRY